MAEAADSTLILICGPSGSGKSTLARRLAAELSAAVVHQDEYFLKTFLGYRDRVDDSFEGPENVDWGRLRRDVTQRLQESAVVAEGHLLAMDEELTSAASLCVILQAAGPVCKSRRVDRRPRPEEERRELADYFDQFVWPAFVMYGQPSLEALEERCRANGKPMRVLDATLLDPDAMVDEVTGALRT